MTNPCCKYIKTGDSGPYLLYEKGLNSKTIINAINTVAVGLGEYTDFPADVEGNFADFEMNDVLVMRSMYDFSEGLLNKLDSQDMKEASTMYYGSDAAYYHTLTKEFRCYLCRRTAQFKTTDGNLSLLDFLEDNLESDGAATILRLKVNCEEFGLATYRGKYSKLSCSTDGHGNCKGYKTEDYYKAATGKCSAAQKEPPPAAAVATAPSTAKTTAFKNLCDIILAETIKSYLL